MRNGTTFLSVMALGIALTFLVACAHGSGRLRSGAIPKTIQTSEPVALELKVEPGREELTSYFSHAVINNFENGQMTKEREEIVEFKVASKITQALLGQKGFAATVKTVAKDGLVDLHDFAFPEKGEELDMILSIDGRVIRAGDYPRSSVFYVPPISLPSGPVKVGDTWGLEHSWITAKNQSPLELEIAGILKALYSCGQYTCADLEISGNVNLAPLVEKMGLRFTSEIWGRMLFNLEKGSVIWSEVQSREEFVVPQAHTIVHSCLTSILEQPIETNWPIPKKPKCLPRNAAVESLPGVPADKPAQAL